MSWIMSAHVRGVYYQNISNVQMLTSYLFHSPLHVISTREKKYIFQNSVCNKVTPITLHPFTNCNSPFLKMPIFWNIVSCNLVNVDRSLKATYCLHHQGNDGGSKRLLNVGISTRLHEATSQKTTIFILVAIRT
jgi:hypothetical protein